MTEHVNDSRTETDDIAPPDASVEAPERADADTLLDQVEAQATLDTIDQGLSRRERRRAEREAAADGLPTFVTDLPMPPMTTLRRGQLGSVVPALVLIVTGGWLTLATTSGAPPSSPEVILAAIAGVVLSLLAQWLGTGRWSRGVFFFAVLVVLVGSVIALSLQPGGLDLVRGYPLLLVAVGLAFALAGVLARPVILRLIVPGLLIAAAGGVALLVTLGGFIPGDWLAAVAPYWYVPLVIVAALLVLAGLTRR